MMMTLMQIAALEQLLNDHPEGIKAKKLTLLLRNSGIALRKTEVNSYLYSHEGEKYRIDDRKWYLLRQEREASVGEAPEPFSGEVPQASRGEERDTPKLSGTEKKAASPSAPAIPGKKRRDPEKTAETGKSGDNKSCYDCMLMRRGDCGGMGPVCEDFRRIPTVTEEEKALWPTDGDATRIRAQIGRRQERG